MRLTILELEARWGASTHVLAEVDARLAAKCDADLVVLPEAALHGYVSPEGDSDLGPFAESLDGPTGRACAALAVKYGVHLVAPLVLREDAALFNAMVCFDPRGDIVFVYRKRHPWIPETWATAGEASPPVVEIAGAVVTIAICYDLHFLPTDAVRELDAADVLLFPSAAAIRARAALRADDRERELGAGRRPRARARWILRGRPGRQRGRARESRPHRSHLAAQGIGISGAKIAQLSACTVGSMTTPTPKLRVLIFSASLRTDSLNTKLAQLAARVATAQGATVDLASMQDFDVPSYDGDLEGSAGIPAGAQELKRRLIESDAFVIASPDNNASIPGVLKNAIDWTSRFRPQPFDERHALLLSASPSMAGGNRGLWSLRIPLEHLGTRVFPDMFSLSTAHKAFAGDTIADPTLLARFEKTVQAFLSLAEAAKHYLCMKRAWVEFLGEPPGSPADRVDLPA
jgi:chromate reductase